MNNIPKEYPNSPNKPKWCLYKGYDCFHCPHRNYDIGKCDCEPSTPSLMFRFQINREDMEFDDGEGYSLKEKETRQSNIDTWITDVGTALFDLMNRVETLEKKLKEAGNE